MLAAFAASGLALDAPGALAQQCEVRVLRPVSDDLGNAWTPGQTLPVDIARGASLCATGGGCTPRRSGGALALQLSNCKVGPAIGGGDRKLVGDPRLSGGDFAKRLTTRGRIADRLSTLGLSNAAADGFADDYVDAPASANAALVRKALNGAVRLTGAPRPG